MPTESFNIEVSDNFDATKASAAELQAELDRLQAAGLSATAALEKIGLSFGKMGTTGLGKLASDIRQMAQATDELDAAQSRLNISTDIYGRTRITQSTRGVNDNGVPTTTTNVLQDEAATWRGLWQSDPSVSVLQNTNVAFKLTQAEIRNTEAELKRLSAEYDSVASSSYKLRMAESETNLQKLNVVRDELQRPDLTVTQQNNLQAQQAAIYQKMEADARRQSGSAIQEEERNLAGLSRQYDQLADASFRARMAEAETNQQRLGVVQSELQRPDLSQVEALNLQAQQSRLTQAIASEPAIGSLAALRAEVSAAKAAFDGSPASVARLENAYKTLTPVAKQANDIQKEFNDTQGKGINIGNLFERQIIRIAIGFAIWQGIGAVIQKIQEVIKAEEQYSDETARFAAITDQSVSSAVASWNRLQNITTQAGFNPTAAAGGIDLAARFTKDAAEQKALVDAGTKLAVITNQKDPTAAIQGLGEIAKSTGTPLSELGGIIDRLTYYFNNSTVPIEQLMTAMRDAPSLADRMGVSFEQAFGILAESAAETGRSTDQINQIANKLDQAWSGISGDKVLATRAALKNVLDVIDPGTGKLVSFATAVQAVSAKWDMLSSAEQQAALEAINAGGSLGRQGEVIGEAFIQNVAKGMASRDSVLKGQADKSFGIIEASAKASADRIAAYEQQLNQNGLGIQSAAVDISKAVGGAVSATFGGPKGFQESNQFNETYAALWAGQNTGDLKRAALARFGLLPIDQLADAIRVWNEQALSLVKNNRVIQPADLFIYPSDLANRSIAPSSYSQQGGFNPNTPLNKGATPATPVGPHISNLQADFIAGGTQSQAILNAQTIDATKYSEQQINVAKQQGIQLENQKLAGLRAYLEAQTGERKLSTEAIDAEIKKLQEQLDLEVKILHTKERDVYLTGAGAHFVPEALSADKAQAPNVQRLQNVDPSQIGQLVALVHMYDATFTKIGAPQQQGTQDLFIGPNNVFKQLVGSNMALQFALEDLTKTTKAQMNGTWNLPAGATALVPISSLDLQKAGMKGAGMSPEALAALLGLNTTTSGVGQKVTEGSEKIVGAITGLGTHDFTRNVRGISNADQTGGRGGISETTSTLSKVVDSYAQIENIRLNRGGELSARGMSLSASPVNVNVSMLPLKTTFNANISVLLNAAVVARAILPILFSQLTRAAEGTGTRSRVGSVR